MTTKIYLVNQTQPSEVFFNETIYTYSNIEAAEECARRLNLEYANNVILDEAGQFISILDEDDLNSVHYYKVESSILEDTVDDEVYNADIDRENEQSDVFVIACYDKEDNSKFLGFTSIDGYTNDKEKATTYNENTVESTASFLEDNRDVSTEYFHYTKADDAKNN